MKSRIGILTMIVLAAALVGKPAYLQGQQGATAQQHEEHHPDGVTTPSASATQMPGAQGRGMGDMAGMMTRMRANDAALDALVQKMNTAKGTAKTDAIAALLTAMVDDRKSACEPMMANMMSMMNMMNGGMGGARTQGAPTPQK